MNRASSDPTERFKSACTKLHIFALAEYRTVLYLDADLLFMR